MASRDGSSQQRPCSQASITPAKTNTTGSASVAGNRSVHASRLRKVASDSVQGRGCIVHHPAFRFTINVIIVANAIQMGIATDMRSSGLQGIWLACDHVFTTIFALELILMLSVIGCSYFKDPWLLFDGFVAVVSAFDTWFLPSTSTSEDFSFIRQFRLLRLLRIAKVTRVSPELAVVVQGLINSLKSMFWIFVLLFVMLYASAIFCVNVLGRSDSGYPGYQDSQAIINQQVLGNWNNYEYFGTVYRAMLSLFGMVLLSEWSLVRGVMEMHSLIVPLFILLVIVVAFGVLNVIIGIVVETTTEAMDNLKSEREAGKRKDDDRKTTRLTEILYQCDTDQDQHLGLEELEAAVDNEDFKELLISLNLPEGFSVKELFSMLDRDGSGQLSKKEFVNGMLRLTHGTPRQRQCAIIASIGTLHSQMKRIHVEMKDEIKVALGDILRELRSLRGADGSKPLEKSPGAQIGSRDRPQISTKVGFVMASSVSTEAIDVPPESTTCVGPSTPLSRKERNHMVSETNVADADAFVAVPPADWNPLLGDELVLTSKDPLSPVSCGQRYACGDASVNTYGNSWETLQTASLVPVRGGAAIGQVFPVSGAVTAKAENQQMLSNGQMLILNRNCNSCQDQNTVKAEEFGKPSSSLENLDARLNYMVLFLEGHHTKSAKASEKERAVVLNSVKATMEWKALEHTAAEIDKKVEELDAVITAVIKRLT